MEPWNYGYHPQELHNNYGKLWNYAFEGGGMHKCYGNYGTYGNYAMHNSMISVILTNIITVIFPRRVQKEEIQQ